MRLRLVTGALVCLGLAAAPGGSDADGGGFAWKGGVTLAPGAVLVGTAAPGDALAAFGMPPAS